MNACAGQKKGAASSLKFEAEATGHLQATGVPTTKDGPKYSALDVPTTLLAILSKDGFVQSTAVRPSLEASALALFCLQRAMRMHNCEC